MCERAFENWCFFLAASHDRSPTAAFFHGAGGNDNEVERMDREEARRLLAENLAEYRGLSSGELAANIGNDHYLQVQGPSGVQYQIEIQFMWDRAKNSDIRVASAIDDGSLRGAFRPVCEDIIVTTSTAPRLGG
jgi:hypothetical protein